MELAAAGLVGGIVLIAIVAAVLRKNFETTLRALGQPHGMSYERLKDQYGVGVAHVVRGHLDGRGFELLVLPDGANGMLTERWTIHLAGALPGGFAAGKNGWLRSASDGCVRVETGDKDFDKKVMVEGRNPHEARWVLDAEPRRAALRDLAAMNALVSDNKVLFHKDGFDNNVARLTARLQRLRAIAQVLDPVTPQV